ncbi:hypothetical protein C0J52_27193, partial [Blattella germanica]
LGFIYRVISLQKFIVLRDLAVAEKFLIIGLSQAKMEPHSAIMVTALDFIWPQTLFSMVFNHMQKNKTPCYSFNEYLEEKSTTHIHRVEITSAEKINPFSGADFSWKTQNRSSDFVTRREERCNYLESDLHLPDERAWHRSSAFYCMVI